MIKLEWNKAFKIITRRWTRRTCNKASRSVGRSFSAYKSFVDVGAHLTDVHEGVQWIVWFFLHISWQISATWEEESVASAKVEKKTILDLLWFNEEAWLSHIFHNQRQLTLSHIHVMRRLLAGFSEHTRASSPRFHGCGEASSSFPETSSTRNAYWYQICLGKCGK